MSKKLGLLALPFLAAGAIGLLAINGTPAHAASASTATTQNKQQGVDTPEANDTPDVTKPESVNDKANVQEGPQDESGAPDTNQSDGETAN